MNHVANSWRNSLIPRPVDKRLILPQPERKKRQSMALMLKMCAYQLQIHVHPVFLEVKHQQSLSALVCLIHLLVGSQPQFQHAPP